MTPTSPQSHRAPTPPRGRRLPEGLLGLFWVALLVGYLALLTVLLEDSRARQRAWRERTVQMMNRG